MKKIISIEYETKGDVDFYVLKTDESKIYVDKKKKTIDGKELFNNIYSDFSASNFFEVEVKTSSLDDEDKKVFGSYVVKLFDLINGEMKKQFPSSNSQQPSVSDSNEIDLKDIDGQ